MTFKSLTSALGTFLLLGVSGFCEDLRPSETTLCVVAAQAQKFDGKLVRMHVKITMRVSEYTILTDDQCPRETVIWIDRIGQASATKSLGELREAVAKMNHIFQTSWSPQSGFGLFISATVVGVFTETSKAYTFEPRDAANVATNF